jgi:hypothetical protein
MYDQSNQKTGLEVPTKAIEAHDGRSGFGGYRNETAEVFRNEFAANNDLRRVIS